MKNIVYYLMFGVLLFLGCNEINKHKIKSTNDSNSEFKKEGITIILDSNQTFELTNYLNIYSFDCGPVFWERKESKDFFFRILKIYSEEHLRVFVEKISLGDEGGSNCLTNRYQIDERMLSLSNFSLHSLDSLEFKDSITIQGLFNKIKYKVNLESLKVMKE